ncbi:MAG: NAD-dependent succinate-semialdehyde dehydrogenase [Rhizobiaceae bacterium]
MDEASRPYPRIQHLIGGDYVDGALGRPVLNPATREELGAIPEAEVGLLDRVAKLAHDGHRQWRRTAACDRAHILKNGAALMREQIGALARTITLEQGKPLRESRAEIIGTAAIFDWLAEESCRISDEVLTSRIPGMEQVIHHEPIGPVLAITPWNMPAMMAGRKIAHALSTGCSVIVKPASDTPAIVMELARILIEAGLPPQAISVIHGNSSVIAKHLIAAPEVRKVSFTGSTDVGRILGALCGHYIKKFTAELGGHAPVIVCADADVDHAVDALVPSKYLNAGQSCMAPTRFLVHRSIARDFTDALSSAAAKITVGDGMDEANVMGAMINEDAVTSMGDLVEDAVACGARVTAGGKRLTSRGAFFAPTVLADVPREARVMNIEPYGPIAAIASFDEPAAAIGIANGLPYGLCAYVFGGSTAQTRTIATELEAGLVGINTVNIAGPMVPFGGVKDSGLGREGSHYGLHDHLLTKTVTRM